MRNTITGIILALAINYGVMLGRSHLHPHHHFIKLGLMLIQYTGWPLAGWAAFNFAKYRGYPGGFGLVVLFVVAPFYFYVVHQVPNMPMVVGLVFTTVAMLPVVVFLTMPDKERDMRELRRRKQNQPPAPPPPRPTQATLPPIKPPPPLKKSKWSKLPLPK